MILVDGHLDIAFNRFCFDRDPRRPARETRRLEGARAEERWRGPCMVGLPDLVEGRVGVVFPTLFVPRAREVSSMKLDPSLAYATAEEAERLALQQLEFYDTLADAGTRMIGTRSDLAAVLASWEDGATGDVGFVPLMEGADPIRHPEDAATWFGRGVRIVGLSWRGTRYAGGTGEPGPVTEAGEKLLPALRAAGMILDLSHASEQAFHRELDLFDGPVIASHSNPRALCEGDRQLSDEMIRLLSERDGVIGAVPFNVMLRTGWKRGAPRLPLARLAESIRHVTDVTGTHEAVAVGSDFDGGFGADSAPQGLDTVADLRKIGDALSDLDFTDDAIWDILGRNWIRFLERSLPVD